MVERMEGDSYYRRFEGIELSPPKLNAVFQNYLEQFPGLIDFSIGDIEDTGRFDDVEDKELDLALFLGTFVHPDTQIRQDRRKNPNNLYRKALFNRMEGFLSRFAHTPASFDALVIDYLDQLYVRGLMGLEFVNPGSFIHKVLDLSHPGGGLFNPLRAHETMMNCYSHIKDNYELLDRLMQKFETTFGKKRLKFANRLLKKIFKDKYGEEEKFDGPSLLRKFEEEYFGVQYAE